VATVKPQAFSCTAFQNTNFSFSRPSGLAHRERAMRSRACLRRMYPQAGVMPRTSITIANKEIKA